MRETVIALCLAAAVFALGAWAVNRDIQLGNVTERTGVYDTPVR